MAIFQKWYDILQNSLVGLILYSNTVTGDRFLYFILKGVVSDFIDLMLFAVRQRMWFLLDEAPPHNASAVNHWLH